MQKVLKNQKIGKRKQKKIAATLHLHQSAKIGLEYVHRENKKVSLELLLRELKTYLNYHHITVIK